MFVDQTNALIPSATFTQSTWDKGSKLIWLRCNWIYPALSRCILYPIHMGHRNHDWSATWYILHSLTQMKMSSIDNHQLPGESISLNYTFSMPLVFLAILIVKERQQTAPGNHNYNKVGSEKWLLLSNHCSHLQRAQIQPTMHSLQLNLSCHIDSSTLGVWCHGYPSYVSTRASQSTFRLPSIMYITQTKGHSLWRSWPHSSIWRVWHSWDRRVREIERDGET